MSILSLLFEISMKQMLRPSIKNVIENLFRKLNVDTSKLHQNKLLDKLNCPSYSPDFNNYNDNENEQMIINELTPKIAKLENYLLEILTYFRNTTSKQDLINILSTVLAFSISEIISPVVERAVN